MKNRIGYEQYKAVQEFLEKERPLIPITDIQLGRLIYLLRRLLKGIHAVFDSGDIPYPTLGAFEEDACDNLLRFLEEWQDPSRIYTNAERWLDQRIDCLFVPA